jgi:hypothetical protein
MVTGDVRAPLHATVLFSSVTFISHETLGCHSGHFDLCSLAIVLCHNQSTMIKGKAT